MNIRIAMMGRHYDAAARLPEELELPEGATVRDALEAIERRLGEGQSLPPSCLVAVGQRHVGTAGQRPAAPLRDGDELVLLAPVAGG